jgi:hypothetical protein
MRNVRFRETRNAKWNVCALWNPFNSLRGGIRPYAPPQATAEAAASVTPQEDVVEAVMAPVRLGGPRVSHGRGIFVWDQDGNKYIDGSGGPAGVFALGHAHPEARRVGQPSIASRKTALGGRVAPLLSKSGCIFSPQEFP